MLFLYYLWKSYVIVVILEDIILYSLRSCQSYNILEGMNHILLIKAIDIHANKCKTRNIYQ